MHLCINHHLSVMSVMSRLEAEDRNAWNACRGPGWKARFRTIWHGLEWKTWATPTSEGRHVKIMAWLSLKAFLPNQIVEEGTMNKLSGHKLSELFQSCTLHVGSRWCFQTNAISYPCLVWSAHFKHRTQQGQGSMAISCCLDTLGYSSWTGFMGTPIFYGSPHQPIRRTNSWLQVYREYIPSWIAQTTHISISIPHICWLNLGGWLCPYFVLVQNTQTLDNLEAAQRFRTFCWPLVRPESRGVGRRENLVVSETFHVVFRFSFAHKPISGWWFGTFFIFAYIGNNHPNWLMFFRGVETTN